MATTTNYGWTTPDDTALVKDGAAAIRTLGSSVDTTTKALNPSTTLGDIEYRSSTANTNTRLGIGTTGQILTVAGGVPSWATAAAVGGFTSLASGTLSGAAVTISSISSSYINLYLFIIGPKSATSGGGLFVRLNNVTTAASCKWSWLNTDGNAVNASSSVAFIFNNLEVLTTTNSSQAQMEIRNYSATGAKKHVSMYTSPESSYGIFGAGVQNTITDAISRIDIFSDNDFNGGTYVLYGVK